MATRLQTRDIRDLVPGRVANLFDETICGALRNRRALNTVLNLSLCGLLVVSFGSGWIASLLGLTEFGIHKYSSIALMAIGLLHLSVHARTLRAQLRRSAAHKNTVRGKHSCA